MTTMRRERRRASMLAVLSLLVFVPAARAQSGSADGVVVDVRADRQAYQLGDAVSLAVRVTNGSPRSIPIPAALDVWVGNVEVFIAAGDGPFVRYTGPGWGLRDELRGGTRTLARGKSWTTEAAILYNHGVKTDHLSAAARREVQERLLDSGFAFQAAGVYRLKVQVHGFADVLESEAVAIAVTEPTGGDRLVWNAMKSDADVAYFLHTGGPKGHPRAAKSQVLVATLQRLATVHPSSRYAAVIRQRLATFETTIERLAATGLDSPIP